MKRLLAAIAALSFSAYLALASSLVPITGPQDPSQFNSTINTLINNIDTQVNGLTGAILGAVSSTATTAEQTLASFTLPPSLINQQGQSIRLCCAGTMANSSHASTSVKLYHGTSSVTTASSTTSGQGFNLELVVTYNASPTSSVFVGTGSISTTVVAPNVGANTTDAMNTSLVAKCTATQGTASAADVVLQNFFIEQIK